VDDALGDAFMVETIDLLSRCMVFEKAWAGVVISDDLEPVI
jgi:hypothetical protein